MSVLASSRVVRRRFCFGGHEGLGAHLGVCELVQQSPEGRLAGSRGICGRWFVLSRLWVALAGGMRLVSAYQRGLSFGCRVIELRNI